MRKTKMEIANELIIANKELALQREERGKVDAKLVVANLDIAFREKEREKRAAELLLANIELTFQNEEKSKRAEELILANSELLFQNKEKEKRAAELIIANKELHFQNEEKEKRAAELAIANMELLFQNEEKGKRAEELNLLNDDLDLFCSSVAHDLQSPARKMRAYASLLENKYIGKFDEQGDSVINSIMRNSKRMSKLIDDLLAFSQLGRKQITVGEIDMNSLLKSIVDEFSSEDDRKRIDFIVNDLPHCKGDESLILQVWINLFSNAIKYSRHQEKALIEVDSHKEGGFIVYNLKDNGVGFDMQYYHKIFGVFQRLHSQEEFEGTGVGLATVQKIINRHSGKVWAESVVNEGTCFHFSLPA